MPLDWGRHLCRYILLLCPNFVGSALILIKQKQYLQITFDLRKCSTCKFWIHNSHLVLPPFFTFVNLTKSFLFKSYQTWWKYWGLKYLHLLILFSSIMPKLFWLGIILYIQQFSLSKSFFCKNSKLLTSSFASGLRPFLVRNWRFLAIIKNFWWLTICDVKLCLWIEADICVYKMCTKTSV